MKFDLELEEILDSMSDKKKRETEEILPPKPRQVTQQPSYPPIPEKEEEAQNDAAEAEPDEDELEWHEPKKPSAFKTEFIPKFKSSLKKITLKNALIVLGIIIGVIALVFGGIKLAQFAKTAYLRPYEKQYGITYPVGIKKKYCDDFGKNPTLAGRLSIDDCAYDSLVYSKPEGTQAKLEKNSKVGQDMHFLSVAVDSSVCNLEKAYSEKNAFVSSSQEIDFEDIYGNSGKYRVIAVYYTNTDPDDDNGYVYPYNLYGTLTPDSFDDFKERTTLRSNFSTGYEMKQEDYFLTVSADSDFLPNYRFVAVAVKEKRIQKVDSVTETKRQHLTQAHCDKLGIDNIYFLVKPWYPSVITNPVSGESTRTYPYDYQ